MNNLIKIPVNSIPRFLRTLLLGITMLTGCTAASMQVEIEVYKGPLAKEPDIQIAELNAYVKEAKQSLENFNETLKVVPETIDGNKDNKLWQEIKKTMSDCWLLTFNLMCSEVNPIKFSKLKAFKAQVEILTKEAGKIAGNNKEITDQGDLKIGSKLIAISDFGTRLKSTGFFWATHSTFSHEWRRARKALVDFSNMASQYGNQIESRADTLYKQLIPSSGKIPRAQLPLSTYIRDTSPTDFINLYSWNLASDIEIWENYLLHPIDSFNSDGTANRVRTFEHLFSDQFWASINKVYANGQGDVAMAFIKDEIGNWNLKSFDQDPSEILKAYTNMTLAAIKGVSKAIAKGATGGADISAGMKVIGKLTSGQIGSVGRDAEMSELRKLRKNALVQLNELSAKQQKLEETKKDKPDEIKTIREETINKTKEILAKYAKDVKKLKVQ